MRDCLNILMVGLVLAASMPVSTAQAAGASRVLAHAQVPSKAETCKPKWPYVVLTCVA